jgi:hypothetical protein
MAFPLLLALALASAFTRTWFTIAIAIAIGYVALPFVLVAPDGTEQEHPAGTADLGRR